MRHKALIAAIAAEMPGRLEVCGLIVEQEAKRLLSRGGGSGHVPSPPGKPPHVQTGALRASVAHALTTDKGCIVGPTEIYGKFHEFGTRIHPKRPFMRPALRNSVDKFPEQFKDLV